MVGAEEEMNLVETVTTIAKCGSTLELHTPAEGFSAVSFLEKMLAVYDGGEGSEAVGFNLEPAEKDAIIRRVFEDVPISRAQCEAGWIEICAFVLGRVDKGEDAARCCRRPSARAKLEVWKRVLEGAVLQGIHLDQQFLVSDLWKSVLDDGDEEPFPRALFEAIVRRVCEADGQAQGLVDGDMKCELLPWRLGKRSMSDGDTRAGASIDKARCTRWVGETYLEAMAPAQGAAIGRSEFLNAWKDHLPDSWRGEVALSKLTVCVRL
jgi:sister chromatid cohesion protein DCC1